MSSYAGSNQPKEFYEKVLSTNRVSKKTKGGNNMSFMALVVVGDKKGRVGAGLGKASDARSAFRKGVTVAKRNLITIKLEGTTIAHDVNNKYGSAVIKIMPAPEGSGIIAGGVVRDVLEMAGVSNISCKMLGSSNKVCNVRCVLGALQKLRDRSVLKKDAKNAK